MSVTGVAGAGAVAATAAVGATYTALRFNGNRVEGSRRLPVTKEEEQDGLVCKQQRRGRDNYSVFMFSSLGPEVQKPTSKVLLICTHGACSARIIVPARAKWVAVTPAGEIYR